MNETFRIGQLIELAGEIRNLAGALADPTTVTFRIREPDGTLTAKIHGTDPELEKTATGRYRIEWPATMNGVHWYRFEGTGAVQAAEEASFTVLGSKVL